MWGESTWGGGQTRGLSLHEGRINAGRSNISFILAPYQLGRNARM